MARSSPRLPPASATTITELTRRYFACAMQLAKVMGLPLTEAFIIQHRESISCCFIESGRVGVRLAARVQLPGLGGDAANDADVRPHHAHDGDAAHLANIKSSSPDGPAGTAVRQASDPPPTAIPADAGLPCQGQLIVDLK